MPDFDDAVLIQSEARPPARDHWDRKKEEVIRAGFRHNGRLIEGYRSTNRLWEWEWKGRASM